MAIFEIQHPNGQMLEIEGEVPPSEQELDTIFQNVGGASDTLISGGVSYTDRQGEAIPQVQPDTTVENKSPLNFGQRTALSMSNDLGGQYDYLQEQFPDHNVYKKPSDTNFVLEKDGQFQEANPRGFDFNDLSSGVAMLPEIIGGVGGAIGGASVGNIPGAVAGASAGSGGGNLIKQNLAGLMGTQRKHDWGETALSGAIGAIGEGTGLALVKGGQKLLNSAPFKSFVANTGEFLHSVPKKYTAKALDLELEGNSLFKGKFDPNDAYHPIERAIREAKDRMPKPEDYNQQIRKYSKRAMAGLEQVKTEAEQAIEHALSKLPKDAINYDAIKAGLDNLIQGYSKGSSTNPAMIRSAKEIQMVNNMIEEAATNPNSNGLTAMDLHQIKEVLYDIANYDVESGIRNNFAKDLARIYNQKLRLLSPEYASANDKYSLVKQIEKEAGGSSERSLAQLLAKSNKSDQSLSDIYARLQKLDAVVPMENKFLTDTKTLLKTQDKNQELLKVISEARARNPKLVDNIKDEATLKALDDLQRTTGVNFTDDLENVVARQMFESWTPGQGGGSGGIQGGANIARGFALAKAPIIGPLFSPKLGGQWSIKLPGAFNAAFKKSETAPFNKLNPLIYSFMAGAKSQKNKR